MQSATYQIMQQGANRSNETHEDESISDFWSTVYILVGSWSVSISS